jgi:hypothetical protein
VGEEVAMGETRRLAGLPALSVVLAAAAITLVTPFAQSASAASVQRATAASNPVPLFRPVYQMTYACANKFTGLMHFAATPSKGQPQCPPREQLVTIPPGPVHVCVHPKHEREVFLVATLSDCDASPGGRTALTLPPPRKPIYFCGAEDSLILRYPRENRPERAVE